MDAHSKPQALRFKPVWVSWDTITVFARVVWSSVGALQINLSRTCVGALPKVKHLCQSCMHLGVVFDNNIWHFLCDILYLWSHSQGFPAALLWKASREEKKNHMWQSLEEGRANKGVDSLQVQTHTWLVPKLCQAGEPWNSAWEEAKQRLGFWNCCHWCSWGLSQALSSGADGLMVGLNGHRELLQPSWVYVSVMEATPSPACELLPEVSPPWLSCSGVCSIAVSHISSPSPFSVLSFLFLLLLSVALGCRIYGVWLW